MNSVRFKFFISYLVISSFAFAQEYKRAEVWTGINCSYLMYNKIELNLEQQARFEEGSPSYKFSFTETDINYEVFKRLKLGVLGRYTNVRRDEDRYRFSGQISYKWRPKGKDLFITHRLRYQQSYEFDRPESENIFRNRIGIVYRFNKKTKFKVMHEFFWLTGVPESSLVGQRTSFALKFDLLPNLESSVFYKIDAQSQNFEDPESKYIVGVNLSYKLNSVFE